MSNTRHLKRHRMPTSWPVKRKNISFISKPKPGPHKEKYRISFLVLLRDLLCCVENAKEAKFVVANSEILLNGKKVTNIKQASGIFDVIEIKATSQKFTLLLDTHGKFKIVEVKDDEICLKVIGKSIIKQKKYQLNLFNGYSIFVDDAMFSKVSVNDSIIYDFAEKKIIKIIPLKESSFVYIFDGKYRGLFGEVKQFTHYKGLGRDLVNINIKDEIHSTAKDYCYPIGSSTDDLRRFE